MGAILKLITDICSGENVTHDIWCVACRPVDIVRYLPDKSGDLFLFKPSDSQLELVWNFVKFAIIPNLVVNLFTRPEASFSIRARSQVVFHAIKVTDRETSKTGQTQDKLCFLTVQTVLKVWCLKTIRLLVNSFFEFSCRVSEKYRTHIIRYLISFLRYEVL